MIGADRQSARMSKVTWRLSLVCHRMLYSCTHMATGVASKSGRQKVNVHGAILL